MHRRIRFSGFAGGFAGRAPRIAYYLIDTLPQTKGHREKGSAGKRHSHPESRRGMALLGTAPAFLRLSTTLLTAVG
ncbi:hypothetical protein [Azospirillum doebereinerae]